MTTTPKTKLGKWSVGLVSAFFLLAATGNLIIYLQGPRNDETFFDNPLLSIVMLSAIVSAISGFVTGLIGITKGKERAVLVFAATLVGLFMLFFAVGEVVVPH